MKFALAAVAGVLFLTLALAGVACLAAALYLGFAIVVPPALAAFIAGALLLAPLLAALAYLSWQAARQRLRRERRRRELEALQAALRAGAEQDPYGFLTAAFLSGVLLSAKADTRERITQLMSLYTAHG